VRGEGRRGRGGPEGGGTPWRPPCRRRRSRLRARCELEEGERRGGGKGGGWAGRLREGMDRLGLRRG
jgi:hypothetical protein